MLIIQKQGIFLIKKMANNRKIPKEAEMLDWLKRGKLTLRPVSFRLLKVESNNKRMPDVDAIVEGSWSNAKATFAAEFKALATPKNFNESINRLKSLALPKNQFPLLIVPYLKEEQLQELEKNSLSGVDFCGNGVIIVPDKFSVTRTGQPNQFTSSAVIKNVYRKNSSLVGRAFLFRSKYDSVTQLTQEIGLRNIYSLKMLEPSLTIGTVSKVLSQLEQDLLIERAGKRIQLLQPDLLLDKLAQNYSEEQIRPVVSLKVKMSRPELISFLVKESRSLEMPIVATGLASVSRYAVMQRDDKLSVYCPRSEDLLAKFPKAQVQMDDRFPNFEVVEMKEPVPYFDAVMEDNLLWSSPLQTYLELILGDKRDQDTATQVKEYILKTFLN